MGISKTKKPVDRRGILSRSLFLLLMVGAPSLSAGESPDDPAEWWWRPRLGVEAGDLRLGLPKAQLQGKKSRLAESRGTPKAALFDGSSFFQVDPGAASWLDGADRIRIEAWVRPDRMAAWSGLFTAIQDNGDFEKGLAFGFKDQSFFFGLSTEGADDGNGKLTYLVSRTVEARAWYHVAATYDGKVQSLWVDGELHSRSTVQSGRILWPKKRIVVVGAYVDDDEKHPLRAAVGELRVTKDLGDEDASARRARFLRESRDYPGSVALPLSTTPDWPTYMRDERRTGRSTETLELPLNLVWSHRTARAPQPAWPPPAKRDIWHKKNDLRARVVYDRAYHLISAEGKVYFGSSADNSIHALSLEDGTELWTSATEGPVRLAPTFHDGRLYVGSDDGCVYAFDANDGRKLWKTRIGRDIDRLPGNGRMISPWPVRTGVLVEGDLLHVCAGLFPSEGVIQATLSLVDGKIRGQRDIGVSPQGYLARRSGRIEVDAGRSPSVGLNVERVVPKGALPLPAPQADAVTTVAAHELVLCGAPGKVAAYSAGKLVWQADVEGVAHSLAVVRGRLLVSTSSGWIYCFGDSKTDPIARDLRVLSADAGPSASMKAWRDRLTETGTRPGYALIVGGDAAVAEAWSRLGSATTLLETHPKQVESLRSRFAAKAIVDEAGTNRVPLVLEWAGEHLPFRDGIFNHVFVVDPSKIDAAEVLRVLKPGGGVVFAERGPQAGEVASWPAFEDWERSTAGDFIVARRKAREGEGEWTHLYGDAGNSACSQDELVGSAFRLQWFGRPGPRHLLDRHLRTVSPLSKDGRLYVPGDERVTVVDAHNGFPLWEREVPSARRLGAGRDCGSYALDARELFVVANDSCLAFAVVDGEPTRSWQVPEEGEDWGFVARKGARLFGSSTARGASRKNLDLPTIDAVYNDHQKLITSHAVFAYPIDPSRKTEKPWVYRATRGAIINPSIAVGRDSLVFVESDDPSTLVGNGRQSLAKLVRSGARLVCLVADSGAKRWEIPLLDFAQLEHAIYVSCQDELILLTGSRNEGGTVRFDLAAYSAMNGKQLWKTTQDNRTKIGGTHGEKDLHPVIIGDRVFLEPFAHDLKTGRLIADWKWSLGARRGCGTVSASRHAFFFRHGNPNVFDLAAQTTKPVTRISRPGCWINILPANGLLLIPEGSSGCTCNFSLQTSMAFWPVGPLKPISR